MSVTVEPVTFVNTDGRRLFGMLHRPAQPRATAVLLLSPGVKMRVAPHRMYLRMAEEFVALGYAVLRFDFEGLGDAEGEVSEALLTDLYGAIQVGRYVSDTVSAMDWMAAEHGVRRFVAAGLCGGAITGLLTAERDPRIVGLIGLAIPVVIEGSRRDPMRYMTTGELGEIRRTYMSKLNPASSESWRALGRLLTFRSSYRLLIRSLFVPLIDRLRRSGAEEKAVATADDNANPLFARALFKMLSTARPVLLVFAGADRLHFEFEEKFAKRHRQQLAAQSGCTIHVTPQSNHIFSMPEWQVDMLAQCRQWLLALGEGEERRLP